MSHKYIYIDFEAISNPFARLLSIPANTPFAYSLGGLNHDNKFETKTFIIDFVKGNSIKDVWSTLKQKIIKHIYEIDSKAKIDEIIFIGHNPTLEKQILTKMFPKNSVIPLIDDKSNPVLSLSKLTGSVFKQEYFLNTKKMIEKSGINILKKMITKSNGLIASFLGFWLYVNSLVILRSNDKRKKYFLKLNKNVVIKELRKYSQDDVNKMLYLAANPEETNLLIKRYLYKKDFMRLIKNINFNDNLTIKEIKQKIWSL
ncbi:DUF2779 domain-containing protein [Metamycoplasma alkalescens]|uniref:DUF2779 domain-containing protein n=2 Tax=Metamycoplasma alkalescens TaxID=45363 RepID=A0A318U5P8_9BACT|nr:DUF2779 domain-containing protein [Metamycoplasma alkalescens]PYF43718.1 hypothetical protein BCF88_10136 [Metamycoplasma alkalescens]